MLKVMFQSAILVRKSIESSRQNSPQQTTNLGSCVHIWCFLETKFQTHAYGSRLQLTLQLFLPCPKHSGQDVTAHITFRSLALPRFQAVTLMLDTYSGFPVGNLC